MFGVSAVSLYERLATVAIGVPLRYTLYPVTPTLSVEAVQLKLICDEEMAVAVRLVGVEGAVVSVD